MSTKRETPAAVHVIDDDESFRASMMGLLLTAGLSPLGYDCVGQFLLTEMEEIAGCVLLDIEMPGPSGIDLLRTFVHRELTPPVIFVTGWDDVHTSVNIMKSGAFDYLVKPVGAERILPVVRRALQIDAQRRAKRREFDELWRRFATLTRPERAIFHGIVRNRLNKQLAADLGNCERTIKVQRAGMMRKLQMRTVPELVCAARLLETGKGTGQYVDDDLPIELCASPRGASMSDGCQPWRLPEVHIRPHP